MNEPIVHKLIEEDQSENNTKNSHNYLGSDTEYNKLSDGYII